MPWGVAAAAVGVAGGIYSSNKASDQQASAQNKNISAQKEGMAINSAAMSPYRTAGTQANKALGQFMGTGSQLSYAELYKRLSPQYMTWKDIPEKSSSGIGKIASKAGGLSVGNRLGLNPITSDKLINGKAPSGKYLAAFDKAGLEARIKKALANQKAAQNRSNYGEGMRNFTNADFVKDPGYQWRLQQGEESIQRGQAARGGLLSGAAAKELLRYGQGYASNEFGAASDRFNQNKLNKYNMLSGQQAVGLNAASGSGAGYSALGDSYATAGANRAAGTMGAYNALAGGISSGLNAYQQNQYLNRMPQYNSTPAASSSANMNRNRY